MRTRIRLAAAALALVTPLAVTGCGGGDEGGDQEVEQEVDEQDEDEDD